MDDDDIADPTPLIRDLPPGSDGVLTDDTGQTFFSTPSGDRMNVAGEIVMTAEEAAKREMERARRNIECDGD